MKTLYHFSDDHIPGLQEAGGKGLSLILMTRAGFPVPPGFVLTVAFFKPWFDEITASPEWNQVVTGTPETRASACVQVKEKCMLLKFTPGQTKDLEHALKHQRQSGDFVLMAVRSSSPEEDLESASFAGGYETSLGVTEASLEHAIRHSFASCFDERVYVYKKEHGFDTAKPQIAVVVQQQIASEISGVAFSLNPLNNCYDEVVINSNFGLGESVVAGQVSPDEIIVHKTGNRIMSKKTGKKETAVWLSGKGGTEEKSGPENNQLSLTDDKITGLVSLVKKVEEYYKKPIDIEWAYAGNSLYLLQARPITAFIPLPEEMLTKPGEPKILYMDHLIVKQGIFAPLSVLGLDYLELAQVELLGDMMGSRKVIDLRNGLFGNYGGRGYANLSNTLKMRGKKQVIDLWKTQDSITSDILETTDLSEYLPPKLPKQLKGILLKAAFANMGMISLTFKAFGKTDEYHKFFQKETEILKKDLFAEQDESLSFTQAALKNMKRFTWWLVEVSLPVTYAAELARSKLKKLFSKNTKEIRDKIYKLEQALPNNITIEMGLEMYTLSGYKEISDCASAPDFLVKLNNKAFSQEFHEAWDTFMETYGHRCPREMDIASSRFYEEPGEFFNQLKTMAQNADEKNNPRIVFEQGIIDRKRTYEHLLDIISLKGKGKAKKFKKYYHILVTLGAYREIHKYFYIKIIELFKKRVVAFAGELKKAGRLDSVNQIFDLTIADLDQAASDPSLDLRALAEENTRFLKKIQHIRHFPRLIDSRGKILHQPKKEVKEGELAGQPISPGTIKGKVKVLNTPDEKPILPGEILVARATDPGWTPLFLNAGGIVLEIGGLLQHGALVAREYCKPCIAGIENITSLLKDGQIIEMNGTTGIIRLIN